MKTLRLLRCAAAAELLYFSAFFAGSFPLSSLLPAVAVAAGLPLLWLLAVCLCLRSRFSCFICLTAELLLAAQAALLTYLILHKVPGDMGFGILMILVGGTFQVCFLFVMVLLYAVRALATRCSQATKEG